VVGSILQPSLVNCSLEQKIIPIKLFLSCHIDVKAAFFYYKRIISSRPYKRDQRKYQGSKASQSHNIFVREALLKIFHACSKYWPIVRGSQKSSFNKLKKDRKINKREFEVNQVGEVLSQLPT